MATEINKPEDELNVEPVDLLARLIGYEEANRAPAQKNKTSKKSITSEKIKILPVPVGQEIGKPPELEQPPKYKIEDILSPEDLKQIQDYKSQAILGQIPAILPTELQEVLKIKSPELEKRRAEIEAKKEQRYESAKSEFEKARRPEMEPGEILARSLIAIAPALIGRAAAGSLGGYAGGQASVTALTEFEKQKQEQQKMQQKYAEEALQAATQFGKGELDRIEAVQNELVKSQLKAGLLPYETQLAAQLNALKELGPKELKAIEAKAQAERQKNELLHQQWKETQQLKHKKYLEGEKLKLEQQRNLTEKERIRKDYIYSEIEKLEKEKEKGQKEPSQKQFEAAGFARRMELAMNDLSNIENSGFNRASFGSAAEAKLVPEYWKSQNFKQYYNAELAFINAVKRKESGAAVKDSEHEEYAKLYFPRAGDGPNVINEKNKRREQKFIEMKSQAGRAFDLTPSVIQKSYKLTPEIYNKMTDQEKIEYKSASPGRRGELIKQVEGR